MKITKESRRAAKKLFRACFAGGQLDEQRVRTAVFSLIKEKPRYYLGILSKIEKLVKAEMQKRSLLIESAVPLEKNRLQEIQTRVQSRFPAPLLPDYSVNPSLIGGLRIKVGSDVWDGSVAARLQQLEMNNCSG